MSLTQPLFEQVFRDMHRAFSLLDEPLTNVSRRAIGSPISSARYPPTDIMETSNGYELHAEIPGYRKEDIDIQLPDDHTLVIGGRQESFRKEQAPSDEFLSEDEANRQQRQPGQESTGTDVVQSSDEGKQMTTSTPYWWRSERFTGSFRRSFTFPHAIKSDGIKANYQDGILTVTVPRAEKSSVRIPIQ